MSLTTRHELALLQNKLRESDPDFSAFGSEFHKHRLVEPLPIPQLAEVEATYAESNCPANTVISSAAWVMAVPAPDTGSNDSRASRRQRLCQKQRGEANNAR